MAAWEFNYPNFFTTQQLEEAEGRVNSIYRQRPWRPKVKHGTATNKHISSAASDLLNFCTYSRTMIVRLISTAQTGYFYTTKRLRTGPKLAAVKYDPTGMLFTLSLFQILMRCTSKISCSLC